MVLAKPQQYLGFNPLFLLFKKLIVKQLLISGGYSIGKKVNFTYPPVVAYFFEDYLLFTAVQAA